jgi:hypothetical protein
MNDYEFQQAEAAGVSQRKTVTMIGRQLIAARTADEIMGLSDAGCLDKELVELLIMSALVQIEQIAHERWLGELGRALKERSQSL